MKTAVNSLSNRAGRLRVIGNGFNGVSVIICAADVALFDPEVAIPAPPRPPTILALYSPLSIPTPLGTQPAHYGMVIRTLPILWATVIIQLVKTGIDGNREIKRLSQLRGGHHGLKAGQAIADFNSESARVGFGGLR